MNNLKKVKLTANGRIKLSESIRNKVNFIPGEQLIVFANKDTIILKAVKQPPKDVLSKFDINNKGTSLK